VWVALASLFMEEPSVMTRALNLVWLLLVFPLGPVIIHLAVLFPEPVRRFSPRRFDTLYVLMSVVAVFFALSYLLRWQGMALELAYSLSTFGYSLFYSVFGVGFFFYIARLNYLLWHSSRRIRRQARLMLGGLLCALPYVVIIILRALFANTPSYFWSGLDLRFLVLAVPLTFAYVILRYQTSQSTHPLLIDVFILAVSVLLASLGTWAFHLFTPNGADPLNNFSPFALLFVPALISGFIWRRQGRWQAVLNRLFLPELRGYGAVWQFGRQVVGQTGLGQLPPAIATALVAHLELERAAVWLWDETKKVYTLAGQAGDWKESPLSELIPDSQPISRPVRLHDELEATPDWLAPARARGSLEVVAPLSVSGRPIGLLGLGQRRDEEIFDERDLEILDLIAQQSALFLLTALQIEQLREVPLQVNAAQERERFTIAQELHDTVQQFLGRLPFYLQVSRDSLRADPAEAESLLQRCIADVESEAQTVRQIRNNLAPLQLEKSLTQPLRLLIEHFHFRTRLEPHLDFPSEVDSHLTLEARHALYRVVQQALDNISEHAQATQVTITFKCEAGLIHFSITDNGRGFSEAQQTEAQDEGSFGLKSMQARITALGGEFSLQSTPGQGTEISGWLLASPPSPV
jgi:signal transduction histidine kinase